MNTKKRSNRTYHNKTRRGGMFARARAAAAAVAGVSEKRAQSNFKKKLVPPDGLAGITLKDLSDELTPLNEEALNQKLDVLSDFISSDLGLNAQFIDKHPILKEKTKAWTNASNITNIDELVDEAGKKLDKIAAANWVSDLMVKLSVKLQYKISDPAKRKTVLQAISRVQEVASSGETNAVNAQKSNDLVQNYTHLLHVIGLLQKGSILTNDDFTRLVKHLYPGKITCNFNLGNDLKKFRSYLKQCLKYIKAPRTNDGRYRENSIVVRTRKLSHDEINRYSATIDSQLPNWKLEGSMDFEIYPYDNRSGPNPSSSVVVQVRNRNSVMLPVPNPFYVMLLGGAPEWELNLYLYPCVMVQEQQEIGSRKSGRWMSSVKKQKGPGKAVYYWVFSIGHTLKHSSAFAMFAPTSKNPLLPYLKKIKKSKSNDDEDGGFFLNDSTYCLYQPVYSAMGEEKMNEYNPKSHSEFYSDMDITFDEMNKKMRRYAASHLGTPSEPPKGFALRRAQTRARTVNNTEQLCKLGSNENCPGGQKDLFPGKKLIDVLKEISDEPAAAAAPAAAAPAAAADDNPAADGNSVGAADAPKQRSSFLSRLSGVTRGGAATPGAGSGGSATDGSTAPGPEEEEEVGVKTSSNQDASATVREVTVEGTGPEAASSSTAPKTIAAAAAAAAVAAAAAAAPDSTPSSPTKEGYVTVIPEKKHTNGIMDYINDNGNKISEKVRDKIIYMLDAAQSIEDAKTTAATVSQLASPDTAKGGKRRRTRKKRRSLKKKRARKTRRSRRKR